MNCASPQRRPLLLSCKVFQREFNDVVVRAGHRVEVRYLPMNLHSDTADSARVQIQAAVDAADPDVHDAVLIGYGVCNYGVRGLVARELPLVVPRFHDCISLLLESQRRYRDFFDHHPNTYFMCSGWVDARHLDSASLLGAVGRQMGLDQDLAALIDKYGEDNGRYSYDTLKRRSYDQYVYISTRCQHEEDIIEQARQGAQEADCPIQIVEGGDATTGKPDSRPLGRERLPGRTPRQTSRAVVRRTANLCERGSPR